MNKTKTAYGFSPIEFDFIGEVTAHLDPLESEKSGVDVFILPSNTTDKKPLKDKDGFVNVFDKTTNKWSLAEDCRGKTFYSKKTGELIVLDSLVVSDELTEKKRPDHYSTWSESFNDWETTPENVILKQTAEAIQKKETLIALAEKRVTDLSEATDADVFDESEIDQADVELLKLWKRYRVFIKKVNPKYLNVIWPESPEQ